MWPNDHIIKSNCCLLLFLFLCGFASAQRNNLTARDTQQLRSFRILADHDYSVNEIISDSSLPFTGDSIITDFKTTDAYWVKFALQNPGRYRTQYYLSVNPYNDDSLYFYDRTARKWQGLRNGLAGSDGSKSYGLFPLTVENDTVNNFYLKLQVSALSRFNGKTKVALSLVNADITNAKDQRNFIIWIATLLIIFMLILYNLYTWFIFKDRAFLYYLCITVGGMIYVSVINKHFNLLTNLRWYQVRLTASGFIYFNDINSLLMHTGILLVITGFIQFTRSYLQTKIILPAYDTILKWCNILLVIPVVGSIASNTGTDGKYTFLLYGIMNYFSMAIMLLIIWVSIAAYRRKYIFGKYFLMANAIPLLLIVALGVYFNFHYGTGERSTLLPNLAVLSQTLTLSLALSVRIHILKRDLGNEQLQAQAVIHNLKMAEQTNMQKELALKEIHHRVKNNLQIINGLLFMQFRDNDDERMKAQLKQSQERIKSMALVHNRLYESDSTVHVYIKDYIRELAADILKSNKPAGKLIRLNIEENEQVNLSLDTSISLGLILNELITNACKYAFRHKEEGIIDILISKHDSGFRLTVSDDGSGLPDGFNQKKSMGLRLVNNLSKQLGGSATFENSNGAVITIAFEDAAAA